jgi:hypothetical protein
MNDILYIVIPFYNYFNNPYRDLHLKTFIEKYSYISNLRIVISEGIYENYLSEDYSHIVYKHIKYNVTQKIWIKENLINLAVENHLPADWRFIAWVDCDVEFLYPDWVDSTIELLQNYEAVQMFDYVFHWNETKNNFNNAHIGYINSLVNNLKVEGLKHLGFAWAINRDLHSRINNLWENNIIGSGDEVIARSITQRLTYRDLEKIKYNYSNQYAEELFTYYKLFSNTNYSYLKIPILNGWHGTWESKKYNERHKILKNYSFNSSCLTKKNNEIISIDTKHIDLIKDISEYMESREKEVS